MIQAENKVTPLVVPSPTTKTAKEMWRKFTRDEQIDWGGSIAFFGVHVIGICAIFTGISWAVLFSCVLHVLRAHVRHHGRVSLRYFSHRTYKTSRVFSVRVAGLFRMFLRATRAALVEPPITAITISIPDTEEDIHSPGPQGPLQWTPHGAGSLQQALRGHEGREREGPDQVP